MNCIYVAYIDIGRCKEPAVQNQLELSSTNQYFLLVPSCLIVVFIASAQRRAGETRSFFLEKPGKAGPWPASPIEVFVDPGMGSEYMGL